MIYVFDIDGTICTNTYGKYDEAVPFYDRIKMINELYDRGNRIFFQTARGMGRSDNSSAYAYRAFFEMTKKQLDNWGINYHSLFLGKPSGDFYIDDKGINDGNFFNARD